MKDFTWSYVFRHVKGWGVLKWVLMSLLSLFLGVAILSPLIFIILATLDALVGFFKTKLDENDKAKSSKKNFKGYAFIDLETTGLKPEEGDKIIEIAILTTDENYHEQHLYQTLVNPNRRIYATHIHLLTDNMVEMAPTVQEINNDILEILDGRILVAHNAEFEREFLNNELYGVEFKPENFLDTLKYSRMITPTENHRLQTIAEYYNVEYVDGHTAAADAKILKNVTTLMLPVTTKLTQKILKQLTPYVDEPTSPGLTTPELTMNNGAILNHHMNLNKWVSRETAKNILEPENPNHVNMFAEKQIEKLNEIKKHVPQHGRSNPPWWRTLSQEGEIGIKIISRKIYHENMYKILGTKERSWEGKPLYQITTNGAKETIEFIHEGNIIGDISHSKLTESPYIKPLLQTGRYRIVVIDDFGPKMRLFLKP